MLEDKELQVVWNSIEYRHKRQVGMGFFANVTAKEKRMTFQKLGPDCLESTILKITSKISLAHLELVISEN